MKVKGLVSAVGALMLVSPFASAGDPVQMWKCNINGDVAEEDVIAQAEGWKKAAGELPGGDGMGTFLSQRSRSTKSFADTSSIFVTDRK